MAWMSRRTFCTAGVSVLALRGQGPALRWALLADTHIATDPADTNRGFNMSENLAAVVGQIREAQVSGALVCGDLAREKGLAGDYAAFHRLIQPLLGRMPVALALGNHDHRANFRAEFGSPTGAVNMESHALAVVETAPLRLLVLDSLLETNIAPGFLGQEQREWLTRFLAEAPVRPTLIFVHHTLGDGDIDLLDVSRLFDIVRGHPSVKAIIYGHSHCYRFDVYDGIHLINLPAVGYNFADREPVGWEEAELTRAGGAFTLHAIGGNRMNNGRRVELTWRG